MSKQGKQDRLYLRINPELKKEVQEYCARHGTSVADIVTRFLVRLLKEDRKDEYDTEQI